MINIIGLIYKPTGATTTDEDGNDIAVMAAIDGWHVNLTVAYPAWAQYSVSPENKQNVFNKGETHCYAFPSQAEFESVYDEAAVSAYVNEVSKLNKWRDVTTAESAKLKYILAEDGILDIIDTALEQQPATVRALWALNNWSRNNQTLIGMVTQMAALPAIGAVVLDVPEWMDSWFQRAIALEV